jgi:hypothetical protein
MQIVYVLRIQKASQVIADHFCCLKPLLKMTFKKYNYENDKNIFKLIDSLNHRLTRLLLCNNDDDHETVNLIDSSSKRLENQLIDISREMNEKLEQFKQIYSNKINDTESKLLNSQIRLQDSLNDFSSNTLNQISLFRDEMKQINTKLNLNVNNLQNEMHKTAENLAYTNKYFNTRLAESEFKFLNQMKRLECIQVENTTNSLFQFESVKETCVTEPKNIKSVIKTSEKLLQDYLYDLIGSVQTTSDRNNNNDDDDENLKSLLINVIDQFKTNENNIQIQKIHMDNMFMNLNRLIVDSLYNLNLENKFNFDKLKQESIRLENRLNSIENQLKQLHFGEKT